jgi:hypothetical protein
MQVSPNEWDQGTYGSGSLTSAHLLFAFLPLPMENAAHRAILETEDHLCQIPIYMTP